MYLLLAVLLCFKTGDGFAAQSSRSLRHYDPSGTMSQRIELPADLAEVSGLAFTPDGRLFAHGDEQAVVYQIDLELGRPVKRFGIGGPAGPLRGDFEDIEVVEERVFLVASSGEVIEAREGADGETVSIVRRTRGLGGACEVEGMTWDKGSRSLLLLCKQASGKRWKGKAVVLALSPDTGEFEPEPRLLVAESELQQVTDARRFAGSAIVRHPRSGTYLLLAGPQRLYAEVDSAGRVLGGGALSVDRHRQPEGIAIAPDLTLLISDEAAKQAATITGYAYRP
jgi:uncharacterized protein YjiK